MLSSPAHRPVHRNREAGQGFVASCCLRRAARDRDQPLVGLGEALRGSPGHLEGDPHRRLGRLSAPGHGRPPRLAQRHRGLGRSAGRCETPRHTAPAASFDPPRSSTRNWQHCRRSYGADGGEDVTIVAGSNAMERPMAQQLDDLSRSLTPLEQDSTIIAVIEMSQASWLVAGIVPGIERHPLKKLEPSEGDLLRLLMRWRAEATQKGRTITRIVVAFEAGRDGFWLARWLRARDIEAYVIPATSVAVSREHRRAKTDRLDTGLLKRVFIGWLRGEPDHCNMAAIPTLAEE